jgi:hypothetical protein
MCLFVQTWLVSSKISTINASNQQRSHAAVLGFSGVSFPETILFTHTVHQTPMVRTHHHVMVWLYAHGVALGKVTKHVQPVSRHVTAPGTTRLSTGGLVTVDFVGKSKLPRVQAIQSQGPQEM